MHGGAPGSGAPLGNKNALKHGMYTREALAQLKLVRDLLRQSRELLGSATGRAGRSEYDTTQQTGKRLPRPR
jgi:hypothetical protein